MIEINEKLPEVPLHAEVVLHVRRHLRRSIRHRGPTAADDLALLFGLSNEEGDQLGLACAIEGPDPLYAAAQLIADSRSQPPRIISLGYDDDHLERCRDWLSRRKDEEEAFDDILASDLATLLALSEARELAVAGAPDKLVPILIEGETGTGKELLAKAIHTISSRCGYTKIDRFEAVHVAGLSPDFMNDELFGHAKGSFTGASGERAGRIEAADGGTVLIDEVGDLGREAQVRLLRFLQEYKLSRNGENTLRHVNVRVLAATWHDLERDIKRHKFRLDLLHRLRVGRIRLPPLRERHGAFQEIVPQMLHGLGHRAKPLITRSATDALATYHWPGNLRELHSVLRVAVANAAGDVIRLEDLPHDLQALYLKQPIEIRAPGILCDDLNGDQADEERIGARIDAIAEVLERKPGPDPEASQLAIKEFLSKIPDSSADHRETIVQVGVAIERNRELKRLLALGDSWINISEATLPCNVVAAVERKLDNLLNRIKSAQGDFDAANEALALEKNHWWRFFSDLAGLPGLDGRAGAELRKALIGTMQVIHSIAPELGVQLNAIIRQGGLPGLRAEVKRLFLESNQSSPVETELPKNHKHWTDEQWRQLVAVYPSKAAAHRATGVAEKTISKGLKERGISETWGQDSRRQTGELAALPSPEQGSEMPQEAPPEA